MRIRVATTNLMAPAGPFFPWGERAEGLADLLSARSPDLIGTQEATPESLKVLQARFPNHGCLGNGRWADGSGIQCAIFFDRDRFQVQDSGHFWMSRNPDRPGSKLPGMGSARVATWATLETSEGAITWLNLHFSHLCRREQARIVLNQLSGLPRPWLVTGDFNSTPWPWWSAHRILGSEFRDLAGEAGGTWNAGIGLPIARLDWILGTPEIQCLGCEVLRAGESDHWPVLADIEWKTSHLANVSSLAG